MDLRSSLGAVLAANFGVALHLFRRDFIIFPPCPLSRPALVAPDAQETDFMRLRVNSDILVAAELAIVAA